MVDVIFSLDFTSDVPIYQQIRNEIVTGIAKEEFLPGDRLPTIRGLAAEIGVNVMTVNKAYDLLKKEGYITTDRRRGAIVMQLEGCDGKVTKKQRKELQLLIQELRIQQVPKEEVIRICSELYEEE